jgi:hypothetical protein
MFHDPGSKQICRGIPARSCEELSEPGACKIVPYVPWIKVIERESKPLTPARACMRFSPSFNLPGREAVPSTYFPFSLVSVSQVTGPASLTPVVATNDGFPSESISKIVPSTFAPTVSVRLPEAKSAKHEVIDNRAITVERALMT